jgi:2-dehydro-3-deoxyphosphogluconate aldolase / (4S)-4-hydroxy-2-oxoglutarate aldolase
MSLPRIIPVVVLPDAAAAVPLARALVAGALPVMEITFRTPAAAASLEAIAAEMPGVQLGAGTVVSVAQAKTAISAGAKFVVSPGLSRQVVEYCMKRGVMVFPGVVTPGEIMAAMELGLDTLKFFPAEQAGGARYLKALCGPFPGIRFIPTGGIDASNLRSYLAIPQVVACGGSWMVKPELIAAGKFEEITNLAREAVELAANGGEKPSK